MAKNLIQRLFDSNFGEPVRLDLSGDVGQSADVDLVTIGKISPNPSSNIPLFSEKQLAGGMATAVINIGSGAWSAIERQPNVRTLRNYARNSTWVRAAIDYKRDKLARAHFELVPADSTAKPSRLDKRVRSEVESLLRQPNESGESYGALKELMIEDYYVVGHGCLELDLRTDLIPRSVETVDAARIAFNKKWDGRDRAVPRYLRLDDSFAKAERWYASEEMMCLVNRPMSYTRLGFSHVEALHKTVLALLSGDEFMIRQLLQPVSEKLISLGEGVTAQQVTDFKYQINQVRDKIAVVGGSKDPRVLNLSGTVDELKILDGCEWFVRQVAAVFNISTAKLKLAVDTSRANTESMMADDLEAIEGDLTRIIELENSVFIDRYRYLGEINLTFSYPIMHRKDERQQASIARQQTGNQPWASINEARVRTGEKPLDPARFPFADEPLINTKDGPVPMSIWQESVKQTPAETDTGSSAGKVD